ncbi:MAG: superoxide dismutase [Arenicella sp.]|jgi:Fe-Mn family superoxide dismutase|nr:superoxide dismutase [Arenicella sp.]
MISPYQLPFEQDALLPFLRQETISFHFEKHHMGYLKKLNNAISGTAHADQSLVEIIRSSDNGVFNNAAQVFNHNFQWSCLTPNSSKSPTGPLAEQIDKSFGSFESFQTQFKQAALGQFGSGWAWLVKNEKGELLISTTGNAATPASDPTLTPILTLDVWEHAYYVDYRNDRGSYVDQFWDFVNWDFANDQFATTAS